MATLAEEIRRKRAAAALSGGSSEEDTAVTDPNDDPDPDDLSSLTEEPAAEKTIYARSTRKGPSYVLVPVEEAGKGAPADTSGHIELGSPKEAPTYPTIAEDQPGPSEPKPPPGIQTDEETGTRYVTDADTGQKVPYAELATEADKQAFKPGDVTLPKQTVEGQGERPATGFAVADPDPDNPDYKTPLSQADERKFQAWVKANKVPFDDSPTSDYDMRGFWKAAQEGDPNASTAVSKFDGKIHFPDTYKTPFHKTFSNESQYATSDAPHWEGNVLVDKNGNVVADETPGKAPDKLTQVERATLVKLPGAQPAPDKLTQVERGQLVGAPAPDKLTQVERGQLVSVPPGTAPRAVGRAAAIPTPPKVQPGELVSKPPPVSPPEAPVKKGPASAFGMTPDEYAASLTEQPDTTATTTAATTTAAGPPPMNAPNGRPPVALIIHHTGGRGSAANVVEGWSTERPGVGSQYIMDRDGKIHETQKEFGYGGTGHFLHSVIPGVSNQTAVGIEIIAKDDADMTPAEIESLKRFAGPKGPYANVSVYGHSQVSPGDRDNEGVRGVAAINEARAAGGKAPVTTGAAVTTGGKAPAITGAAATTGGGNYITGRATTFGHFDPDDSGVGAPKLGRINTNDENLIGIAVPQAALERFISQHPADWRKARVEIVTGDGRHLLVPIVDLGPRDTSTQRGVVADFTYRLNKMLGNTGEQNYQFRIVANAGPDVMKDPQRFADEQAALAKGIYTGPQQKAAAKTSYVLAPVAPAITVAAQAANQFDLQGQQNTLTALHDNAPNMPDWYHSLEKPIPGVSDAVRNATRENFKQQITAYAQDYYKEPDPAKAFERIMSAPNLLTSAGEIWTKAGANFQHAWLSLAQQADSPTQTKLIDFVNAVHPEATPEARTALISQVMSKTGKDRADFVNALYNHALTENPDSVKNVNMYSLLDAIDVSAQPGMQAKEAENHARVAQAVANNIKDLRADPTMENTYGGVISNAIAQLPKNVAEALIPVIGQSAMFSEIYTDTLEGLRKDHPDWNEDQLKAKAAAASLPQDVLQEVINLATLGLGGAAVRGITNPVMRIAANSILHGGIAAGAGTAQQAVANVATGRPVTEGLPQAAVTGGIQGLIGGAIHTPEARVRVPEETTGPRGAPIHGAEEKTLAEPQPITAAQITGPEVSDVSVPWYKPGPLVSRAEERTAFSPQELASKIQDLRQRGWTPAQIQQAIENLSPEPDFTQRTLHLGAEAQADLTPPSVPVTQEDVARRTYEIGQERQNAGQPGTAADDYAQAQKELSQATEPVLPATVSEAEPINSAIANRYVQERTAAGELGQIDPAQGKSTEDMVQQGLQMSPKQRDTLIDNFTKGKGGDLDQQGAAIRSKEALLSEHARAASRAANADPANPQLQAQAKAAADAVTAFHNGPIKKFKKDWSNAGRALQREIPLDYTTFNGMKEAYLKGNNKEAPANLEPGLKRMADAVSKTADAERVAMNNFGKEIEARTRGNRVSDEQVRTRLMEIMRDLPCPT